MRRVKAFRGRIGAFYVIRVRSQAWLLRSAPVALLATTLEQRYTGDNKVSPQEWPLLAVAAVGWTVALVAFVVAWVLTGVSFLRFEGYDDYNQSWIDTWRLVRGGKQPVPQSPADPGGTQG